MGACNEQPGFGVRDSGFGHRERAGAGVRECRIRTGQADAGADACGTADKREAAALVGRIPGLRCVDCGRLEMARITESLTALLISVNGRYKAHAGIRLTGLDAKELWPPPPSSS